MRTNNVSNHYGETMQYGLEIISKPEKVDFGRTGVWIIFNKMLETCKIGGPAQDYRSSACRNI